MSWPAALVRIVLIVAVTACFLAACVPGGIPW